MAEAVEGETMAFQGLSDDFLLEIMATFTLFGIAFSIWLKIKDHRAERRP